MRRVLFSMVMLAGAVLTGVPWAMAPSGEDVSPHKQGFVASNGIRLQFLDWGGKGPPLILIHGAGDNPHVFDDLAPAFTDRFHVIAYARRGCGESDARGPYDNTTLTEDLVGLMNALHIAKADLVGWSQGGNEITELAARHPERARRIVYLDGGYDWGDPEYVAAFRATPPALRNTPDGALKSWDAYVSYLKRTDYNSLDDMRRIAAYLRGTVIIKPDGSLEPLISQKVSDASLAALLTDRRDYIHVRAAALAIYAQSMFELNVADASRRESATVWEGKYMAPFRSRSIERIRRELHGVEVISVPGAHDSFFLTSREDVVTAIRRFFLMTDTVRR